MVVFSYEWWWPPFFTERRCACGNYFQCAVENSPTQNMSSSEDCLTLVDVPENRYDDAIHHLRWNFFADEPLNNAIGLCARGESQRELERHCLLTLRQGYSRMLVDKKGAVSEIPSYHKIYIIIYIYLIILIHLLHYYLYSKKTCSHFFAFICLCICLLINVSII